MHRSVGSGTSASIYGDLKRANDERTIVMKQMPLQKNQVNPMHLWQQLRVEDEK